MFKVLSPPVRIQLLIINVHKLFPQVIKAVTPPPHQGATLTITTNRKMLPTHTFLYHAEHWFLLFKKNWHWNKVTSVFVFIPPPHPPPCLMWLYSPCTFAVQLPPRITFLLGAVKRKTLFFIHDLTYVWRKRFAPISIDASVYAGCTTARALLASYATQSVFFTQRFQFYVRNYGDCVVGHGCYKTWVTHTQCCAWMHPL